MSRLGPNPTRGFRHTTATIRRARELHAARWSYGKISKLLSREAGHHVSQTTVLRWCDPEQLAKAQAGQQRRNRTINTAKRSGRIGTAAHTLEFQEHRARQLADVGELSGLGIYRVMRFDYPGQGWTRQRVRDITAR